MSAAQIRQLHQETGFPRDGDREPKYCLQIVNTRRVVSEIYSDKTVTSENRNFSARR